MLHYHALNLHIKEKYKKETKNISTIIDAIYEVVEKRGYPKIIGLPPNGAIFFFYNFDKRLFTAILSTEL